MVFFFCKQKTAYEMRISDWSSVVCSSDRDGWSAAPLAALRDDALASVRLGLVDAHVPRSQLTVEALAVWDRALGALRAAGEAIAPDRKSVAQGESVSVRVDLGGRVFINTKRNLCWTKIQHKPINQK